MGTRNLTMVINKMGEIKVAQYGQWDGYPSGQGYTALSFCRDKNNLLKLQEELEFVQFAQDNKVISDWIKNVYTPNAPRWSNEPDNRTAQEVYWWERLQSRDLGAGILESILTVRHPGMYAEARLPDAHHNMIYLDNATDFGKESLFCEWAYCINFQTNKLECFIGFNTDKSKEHPRFATTDEEIEKEFKDSPTKYYGIRLIKEYDLDNLPTNEVFVKELESEEE